jgi:hypothetical protein
VILKTDFNDGPALEYIRQRGYASYSSLKNVRDGKSPEKIPQHYLTFGTEIHSRFLEGKAIEKLNPDQEKLLTRLTEKLNGDKMVQSLMRGAEFEVEFKKPVNGLTLYGFIDILRPKEAADLKTTSLTSKKAFIESMDFLQPAIYLEVSGRADFYYIGVSKVNAEIFTFNVNSYPARMKDARAELKKLIKYVKSKI